MEKTGLTLTLTLTLIGGMPSWRRQAITGDRLTSPTVRISPPPTALTIQMETSGYGGSLRALPCLAPLSCLVLPC